MKKLRIAIYLGDSKHVRGLFSFWVFFDSICISGNPNGVFDIVQFLRLFGAVGEWPKPTVC